MRIVPRYISLDFTVKLTRDVFGTMIRSTILVTWYPWINRRPPWRCSRGGCQETFQTPPRALRGSTSPYNPSLRWLRTHMPWDDLRWWEAHRRPCIRYFPCTVLEVDERVIKGFQRIAGAMRMPNVSRRLSPMSDIWTTLCIPLCLLWFTRF